MKDQEMGTATARPPRHAVRRHRDTLQAHVRVARHLASFVEGQLSLLKPIERIWQPHDLLPDLTAAHWQRDVQALRDRAKSLSDELLVVLVGDMITEEALPSYQTMLNRHPGVQDDSGASRNPWAQWSRGWSAEENRHGELLGRYLYLSGRVDMRAVEVATHCLIRNGFDPQTDNDPYRGLVYAAFQERATRISHGNVARLAGQQGEPMLEKLCAMIAGDEARHEEAYKRFVGALFGVDPAGAVVAVARMMRTRIVMPGLRMTDATGSNLFGQFAAVAQRIGAYTVRDYAQIIAHLVEYWRIPQLTGLVGDAAEAQVYLCGSADRCLKLADRITDSLANQPRVPCHWIFGRVV